MKVVNIETKQSAYMMAYRVMSEAELQQSATKCNKVQQKLRWLVNKQKLKDTTKIEKNKLEEGK